MAEGVSSSSVMVVVVVEAVPETAGAGPPPPCGFEMAALKVSSSSSRLSCRVWTVKVWSPALACVKVSVPDDDV